MLYSNAPGVPIPDNNAAGVDTTITVPDSGTITDVNVQFESQHTWVGDLQISLESPAGTVVSLLDRPGEPASAFGCSDDLGGAADPLLFDDASMADSEAAAACDGSPFSGTFAPVSPLSAFNGEDLSGDWTLRVADLAGGDLGNIDAWTLDITFDAVAAPGAGVQPVGGPILGPVGLLLMSGLLGLLGLRGATRKRP